MIVSGLSECVDIWFCIYLLGIDGIPESTEPSLYTHELRIILNYIDDISPIEFLRIHIKNLTPSAVVYKIFGNVLAENGFHRLFGIYTFKISILSCYDIFSTISWLHRMNNLFWNNAEISTYIASYISVYLQEKFPIKHV